MLLVRVASKGLTDAIVVRAIIYLTQQKAARMIPLGIIPVLAVLTDSTAGLTHTFARGDM